MRIAREATRVSCRRVAKWIQSYLDGELDASQARSTAAHLEECRRCGLEARTYEALRVAIAAAGDATTRLEPAAVHRLRAFAATQSCRAG